jgi:ketosteroid isomerase-like protein
MTDKTNENHIRLVIERWANAVRDVDMEGILAHHTDDILMFDVPPPVQCRGKEAYKKTWELFFEYSSGGGGSFELHELEITASDSVAFAHALLDVAGSTARLTVGLTKVQGDWLIAHEHHSYPSESE